MTDLNACPNTLNSYKGTNKKGYNSFIAACKLDETSQELLTMNNAERESILIKRENVISIVSYGTNKILVHISDRRLLIIHDW